MAKHTSIFSKAKGNLAGVTLRGSGNSPGSVSSERQIHLSIPQEDFTNQNWNVFLSSKITALFRTQINQFLSLNHLVRLLPQWQSITSVLLDTATFFQGPGDQLEWRIQDQVKVIPHGSLHFPSSGMTSILFGPARYRWTWSTENGSNGSPDDLLNIFMFQELYRVVNSDGSLGFRTPWAITAQVERSVGEVEITFGSPPPGNSNILASFAFMSKSTPAIGIDSSSLLLLLSSLEDWNLPNQ